MRAPRSNGAAQDQAVDVEEVGASISSAPASPLQVPFLRRRLADAILRGDDIAAERLRQALDAALNGSRS